MKVQQLYQHNYSQAVRNSLGHYTGPYELSVDRGPDDEAILTLNLPATQQGHFRADPTVIRVADQYVPLRLQFNYVPMALR